MGMLYFADKSLMLKYLVSLNVKTPKCYLVIGLKNIITVIIQAVGNFELFL